MRTIAHLSDLHYGSINEQIVDPLIKTISQLAPDLVVVSGDLTQRARSEQFTEARAFLDSLPCPQIVVPGNHDVPFYNIFARFAHPLEKYRRYITDDLRPSYVDDEIAVLGVNTARALAFKGGRINETQVAWLRDRFCAVGTHIIKIVVTHHPFELPRDQDKGDLVGRARMALEQLATCGADVFLAGHLHISRADHMAKRYKAGGLSSVVVQAGTATSTRKRGEVNSFNLIRIDKLDLTIQRLIWQPGEKRFDASVTDHFRHSLTGWSRL